MAYENIHSSKSIKATASLVASQYCFVTLDANGQLILLTSTATTAGAIGVLQDKPGAGDPGFVCGPGDITKVQCGGTIAAGGKVMTNATGQAVAATAAGPSLGWALAAGASGGITDILFQPDGFTA
jgi:hypothetical protein